MRSIIFERVLNTAYWETDDKLRAIAEKFDMTTLELADAFCSLSIETRNQVRPLLHMQLRNIESLRRKRLSTYENVLILGQRR